MAPKKDKDTKPSKRTSSTNAKAEFVTHKHPGAFRQKDSFAPNPNPPSDIQAELEGLRLALLDVLDEYRDRWLQLLGGKALKIQRQGERPFAVVIAYEDFEALLERLEDLEDAQAARDALAAIERGEETTVPWEKLKAELTAEGLLDA